MKRSRRW